MKEWKWSLFLLPMISVQSAMPTFTFLLKPIALTGFVQIASCSSGTSSCKCPLCRRPITLLIPTEHSLSQRHDPEVAQILSKIHAYNRVFGGQSSSFFKAASGVPKPSKIPSVCGWSVLCATKEREEQKRAREEMFQNVQRYAVPVVEEENRYLRQVVVSSHFALARFSPSLAVAVGRNLAVSGGRVVPPSVVALFLLCSCDLFRTHLRVPLFHSSVHIPLFVWFNVMKYFFLKSSKPLFLSFFSLNCCSVF
ncbi:hypothetical protein LR48_Vigan564s002000 [Vigna angularis]|uniref:Uncharacterized protein n=1 Tax=Phaseolus angularis TaxID=3914 RepID=A0A0L9TDL1_PHAAN|nr:hypothetical protein LR48_Vigan564s002000 [Vigna angularis]